MRLQFIWSHSAFGIDQRGPGHTKQDHGVPKEVTGCLVYFGCFPRMTAISRDAGRLPSSLVAESLLVRLDL